MEEEKYELEAKKEVLQEVEARRQNATTHTMTRKRRKPGDRERCCKKEF